MFAGNDGIHESLDEFEIWPDPTNGFHGNRYGYKGKKQCCHFFSAVFIRSFSYLRVMMTCMRARRSSKFGQIRLLTAELAALKRLKKIPIDLLWQKWCCHLFSAILDQIFFILAGNDDIHKSLDDFEIRPDPIIDHRGSCS